MSQERPTNKKPPAKKKTLNVAQASRLHRLTTALSLNAASYDPVILAPPNRHPHTTQSSSPHVFGGDPRDTRSASSHFVTQLTPPHKRSGARQRSTVCARHPFSDHLSPAPGAVEAYSQLFLSILQSRHGDANGYFLVPSSAWERFGNDGKDPSHNLPWLKVLRATVDLTVTGCARPGAFRIVVPHPREMCF